MADPFDYDGTDLDLLEPFQINKDNMIYLIKKTEHPTVNNVHLIDRNSHRTASEREGDNQDGQVTEEVFQD